MQKPEKTPPLLDLKRGLENANGAILMERYKQSYVQTTSGIKLYENGQLYKIYRSSTVAFDSPDLKWDLVTTLSEKELNKVRNTYKNQVTDFIKNPTQEYKSKPVSYSYWYFYIDGESFVKSQDQHWKFDPRFVRILDRIFNKY